MGPVESGVRTTFTNWGILEPVTAYECMAINLAQILDGTSTTFKMNGEAKFNKDDKTAVASINRELRLTLEKIDADRPAARDDLDDIASKY